jgi:hypothetical protein
MRMKPNRFNNSQMLKVGVEILDPKGILLKCVNCGQQWSPNLLAGGRLPKNYWHCPNNCNV